MSTGTRKLPDFRGLEALARRVGNHSYAQAPGPATRPTMSPAATQQRPKADDISARARPANSAGFSEKHPPKPGGGTRGERPSLTPARSARLGEGYPRYAGHVRREAMIIDEVFRAYYRMDICSPEAWA